MAEALRRLRVRHPRRVWHVVPAGVRLRPTRATPRRGLRLPALAAGVPADEAVGRDELGDALPGGEVVGVEPALSHELGHGRVAEADRQPRWRPAPGRPRRGRAPSRLLHEADARERAVAAGQLGDRLAQDRVGLLLLLDDRLDGRDGLATRARSCRLRRLQRAGTEVVAERRRRARRDVDLHQRLLGRAEQHAVALVDAAYSQRDARVRPRRATRTNTSSRSSKRAGAWYSTWFARITNSCAPARRQQVEAPQVLDARAVEVRHVAAVVDDALGVGLVEAHARHAPRSGTAGARASPRRAAARGRHAQPAPR